MSDVTFFNSNNSATLTGVVVPEGASIWVVGKGNLGGDSGTERTVTLKQYGTTRDQVLSADDGNLGRPFTLEYQVDAVSATTTQFTLSGGGSGVENPDIIVAVFSESAGGSTQFPNPITVDIPVVQTFLGISLLLIGMVFPIWFFRRKK